MSQRFQFNLTTLFIFITVVGILCSALRFLFADPFSLLGFVALIGAIEAGFISLFVWPVFWLSNYKTPSTAKTIWLIVGIVALIIARLLAFALDFMAMGHMIGGLIR